MYPRVVINKTKLKENTEIIVNKAKAKDIHIFVVTKVHSADINLARICLEAGVSAVADSRIQNLIKLKELPCEKILLRLPMLSEVEDVVKFADISFNSELETIEALNQAAMNQGIKHRIVVMFDLGDLREGFLPEDVDQVMPLILKNEWIKVEGIGVNLTCYGGVIPTPDNLSELTALANHIEKTYNLTLNIVSGGNSSSLYLLDGDSLPNRINNLRIGEGIVLGREAAYGEQIPGTHDDAFILEAQIVEYKFKNSVPRGLIGMDAFGNKPIFEDQGMIQRGIVAIGRQDVDHTNLIPVDERLKILGASSDHMILDFTLAKSDYKVGDILSFKMEYGAMLKLFTSEYVEKVIL
ncbi:MAG: alanine racemase [Clostridiales bacterium 38-18]|nr:MAG: alanine racemase [Clostridiales bacterium 38-18]